MATRMSGDDETAHTELGMQTSLFLAATQLITGGCGVILFGKNRMKVSVLIKRELYLG